MATIAEIKADLANYIAGLSPSDSFDDILLVVSALADSDEDRTISIDTIANLPPAHTLPIGTTVYCEEVSAPVLAFSHKWQAMDGTTIKSNPINLYAWGSNGNNRLGTGDSISRSSPTTIATQEAWDKVFAGGSFCSAQSKDGVLYEWGNVRRPNTTASATPGIVRDPPYYYKEISSGGSHTLGLLESGVMQVWGRGTEWQLGIGSNPNSQLPRTPIGDFRWKSIFAGGNVSGGITVDGIAYMWGNTNTGVVGDGLTLGTYVIHSSPNQVVGGITNWRQISTGGGHTLGITEDDVLWAWGSDGSGRLGTAGLTGSTNSPVTVVGNITNWSQCSAGSNHSLAITKDGTLYCWGEGQRGQLGEGSTSDRNSPVTVAGGITNWVKGLAAGEFNIALTSDGEIYGWGLNTSGQLGDNTVANRTSPVTPIGSNGAWTDIAAGGGTGYGINSDY